MPKEKHQAETMPLSRRHRAAKSKPAKTSTPTPVKAPAAAPALVTSRPQEGERAAHLPPVTGRPMMSHQSSLYSPGSPERKPAPRPLSDLEFVLFIVSIGALICVVAALLQPYLR